MRLIRGRRERVIDHVLSLSAASTLFADHFVKIERLSNVVEANRSQSFNCLRNFHRQENLALFSSIPVSRRRGGCCEFDLSLPNANRLTTPAENCATNSCPPA